MGNSSSHRRSLWLLLTKISPSGIPPLYVLHSPSRVYTSAPYPYNSSNLRKIEDAAGAALSADIGSPREPSSAHSVRMGDDPDRTTSI